MKTLPRLTMLALLASPIGAHAHSMLHASVPADGAVLALAPSALELEFGSSVRLLELHVKGANGAPVDVQPPTDKQPASHFKLPLPALPPQHYTVEWSVMGADTHRAAGSFGFDIGTPPQ